MSENGVGSEIDTIYNKFLATTDLLPTLNVFNELCGVLDINQKNYKTVFSLFKTKLTSWKCQTLFNKLEKKSKHVDYKNKPCAKIKVLIIGAGPVGLRTAIEAALLGAQVVVVEKRVSFSRNNVLHLWPFLIVDLKALGVKSFFGKFCAGCLDHISIRRLQCILLKICLLLGVQVYTQTMFLDVLQPTEGKGWCVKFRPASSILNETDFDVVVGCDGKYNGLKFKRKEFRGKLAIAITCNFVNNYTKAEASVEEISGVAFIYNQEFFQQLTEKTGIQLENIVYYKDETHYFVMTAKKQSLLNNGVIKQNCKDVFKLLSADNVCHEALLKYAEQAADFSTKYKLPHHDFAKNHYGKEDVAMFDFTSIHQADCASKIIERKGKRLLLCIAGDVLLEPFWPTGSGCARGFLGAMDTAWMIRGFGLGRESLDLIQERESIFNILPQSKPDSLIRFHDKYSIDPNTRYSNLNSRLLRKDQVSYLLDNSSSPFSLDSEVTQKNGQTLKVSKPIKAMKSEADPDGLLAWCKEQTESYPNVNITDMSSSWKSGLAFCAIINRYRPDLLDYFSLDPENVEENCAMAFSLAEEHFGIPPKISSHDIARQRNPDVLAIMAYVSLYYQALKAETPALIYNESINQAKEFFEKPCQGLHVALVSRQAENKIQTKSETSLKTEKAVKNMRTKMSIISRLSRSTQKNKAKLKKKSKKDKEMNTNPQGVALTAYKKSNPSRERKVDTGKSDKKKANSDQKVLPIVEEVENRTEININYMLAPSPQPERKTSEKGDAKNEVESREVAKDDKYRRISQLAQTVFGDTIVQTSSAPPAKEKLVDDLSESERCHFCKRKVYVMERQSCEGLFFHRKCFRCCVCKCQLLLGNYAFDWDDSDDKGRFYCKLHFNDIIYQTPKKSEDERPARKNRPVTQLIELGDVRKARQTQSSDIAPQKFRNAKGGLKNRIPQVQLDGDAADGEERSPYDKYAARSLATSQVLTSPPKKVTTKSFFTSSKFSVSTPNLTKLIQEDSMFEKERQRHRQAGANKKKLLLASELLQNKEVPAQKKKLAVPENLLSTVYGDDHREVDRYQSFKMPSDGSAVHRRPLDERRAQYPVSMAFSEGARSSAFRTVAVDINLDEESDKNEPQPEAPQKKKKLVLKKKKKVEKKVKEVSLQPSPDEMRNKRSLPVVKRLPVVKEDKPTSFVVSPESVSLDFSDSTSSSGEEEFSATVEKRGFFKAFTKKPKQKVLNETEKLRCEQKAKHRQQRKIRKEMKEREMKRLWEAQSIQRKITEVDVQQFDLEERARKVERKLRDENLSKERLNNLTIKWCELVNEKNTLLRFESELVIQSNSIQLEDRQARLEQQIRDLLTSESPRLDSHEQIDRLTKELVDTVEQRNALVEMLEEDRLREMEEDKTLKEAFSKKARDFGMDRLI